MQQADYASIIAGAVPAPGIFDPATPWGREAIEHRIEELIALLDQVDGDADTELDGDELEDSERLEAGIDDCGVPIGQLGFAVQSEDDEDDELAAGSDDALHGWWMEKAA